MKENSYLSADVKDILSALGIEETLFIGRNGMDTFIEIPPKEGAIQNLKPNFQVSALLSLVVYITSN